MTNPTPAALQAEIKRLTDENRDLRVALDSLQNSVRALSEMYLIAKEINFDTNLLQMLAGVLDVALEVMRAADGSLLLVDESHKELVFVVARGRAADPLLGYRMPMTQGIAGWVVAHNEPQAVSRASEDPRFYPLVDKEFDFSTRSLLCAPVCLDNERVMGVIEVLNKAANREFTENDLHLLTVVAQLAAVANHRVERTFPAGEQRDAAHAQLLRRH